MVEFTEDQIEDIKDGFDLYDRKGSTEPPCNYRVDIPR